MGELSERLRKAGRGLCTENPADYIARGISAADAMESADELDRKDAEIDRLTAELAEAHQVIIAFAGPAAVAYAKSFGLPDGHLHPDHYDVLEKAGARMDKFTRSDFRAFLEGK